MSMHGDEICGDCGGVLDRPVVIDWATAEGTIEIEVCTLCAPTYGADLATEDAREDAYWASLAAEFESKTQADWLKEFTA